MDFLKRNGKRIGVDAAGYLLIVAAILTGWLPGPGGIPLAIAGLGLLSIHNQWAKDLRSYILKNGGQVVRLLFPRNRLVEFFYDLLVGLLFLLAAVLGYKHAAVWQLALALAAFFFALFIALLNRDRLKAYRTKHKRL